MATTQAQGEKLAAYLTKRANAWAVRNHEPLTVTFAWEDGALVGQVTSATGSVPPQLAGVIAGWTRRVGATVDVTEEDGVAYVGPVPVEEEEPEEEGPTVLFADDFAGDLGEYAVTTDGDATAAITSGALHIHGTGAAGDQVSVLAQFAEGEVASHVVSARAEFRIDQGLGPLEQQTFFQLESATEGYSLAWVVAQDDELVLQLQTQGDNGSVTATGGSWPADIASVAHTFELLYDWSGAAPVATLYIDGVAELTATDTDPGPRAVGTPEQVRLGTPGSGTTFCDYYVDNLSVADGIQGMP